MRHLKLNRCQMRLLHPMRCLTLQLSHYPMLQLNRYQMHLLHRCLIHQGHL
jgi:hypothetical protein